jgi:hypothetical protein
MKSPNDVRSTMAVKYRRGVAGWLAAPPARVAPGADSAVVVSIPLDAPSARVAHANPAAVDRWVTEWQRADSGPLPWTVSWEERHWSGYGRQHIPVRVVVSGAAAVARCAGDQADWALLSGRVDQLVDRFGAQAHARPARAALAGAVRSALTAVRGMTDADFDRAVRVVEWIVGHPSSGLLLRQLPVEGMDTKWLEHNRRIVTALVSAVRDVRGLPGGIDLGLRSEPEVRDIVVLDPRLRPRPGGGPAGCAPATGVPGLRHFRADAEELAGLWEPAPAGVAGVRPRALLVCENRQSLVALPDMSGVVALHGGGYAVSELHCLDWAVDLPVLYWGDLDVDGFGILNRLRHHHGRVRSVLMDVETLDRHAVLCVPDPRAERVDPAALDLLTEHEHRALQRLHELGGVRLEQERLAWLWVSERLKGALALVLEEGERTPSGSTPPAERASSRPR